MPALPAPSGELAAARGLVLSVFHNRRWDADFLTVLDVLSGGALGDVMLGLHRPSAGRVQRSESRATAYQKLYQDPVAAFPPRRALGRTLADVARAAGEPPARTSAPTPRPWERR